MTTKNYAAWEIRASDFSESWDEITKLLYFARYAILAPSGHNTQPWQFEANGNSLLLKANYNRRLPYSGVQANEPFVSLGACLGIFELAAKGFGYEVVITYAATKDTVATFRLGAKTTPDPSLLQAIVHRVSNRAPYDLGPLPESVLKELSRTQLKHVSTYDISARADIEYVASQTSKATLTIMSDKGFRAELSKWVRNNLTKQFDGMPGFVQGIPTPPSMLAKHIIKKLDISKDQAKKDSDRVLKSPNLMIISIAIADQESLLNAGRLYSQICVLAQQKGIATTGIGAAIIDPVTTKEIAEKFHLQGKPVAIIRLGKTATPAKHTPRWPLSEVLD